MCFFVLNIIFDLSYSLISLMLVLHSFLYRLLSLTMINTVFVVLLHRGPSLGVFFLLPNMKFHSKKNGNTTEISEPSLFKKGWEILREIHNQIARRRSQFGQHVSCHIGLTPNPTEITNTKLRC